MVAAASICHCYCTATAAAATTAVTAASIPAAATTICSTACTAAFVDVACPPCCHCCLHSLSPASVAYANANASTIAITTNTSTAIATAFCLIVVYRCCRLGVDHPCLPPSLLLLSADAIATVPSQQHLLFFSHCHHCLSISNAHNQLFCHHCYCLCFRCCHTTTSVLDAIVVAISATAVGWLQQRTVVADVKLKSLLGEQEIYCR